MYLPYLQGDDVDVAADQPPQFEADATSDDRRKWERHNV